MRKITTKEEEINIKIIISYENCSINYVFLTRRCFQIRLL